MISSTQDGGVDAPRRHSAPDHPDHHAAEEGRRRRWPGWWEMEAGYQIGGLRVRHIDDFNQKARSQAPFPAPLGSEHAAGPYPYIVCDRRRAGRPDDDRAARRGGRDRADHPVARRRDPPGAGHPASVGGRGDRPDQDQRPNPAGVRDVVADRQPGHPGPAGRGEADRRHGRRAVPADGRKAKPLRLQGFAITDERSTPWCRPARTRPSRSTPTASPPSRRGRPTSTPTSAHVAWTIFLQAVELVVSSQFGSTSMLQQAAGRLRQGGPADGPDGDPQHRRTSKAPRPARCRVKPDELAATLMLIRGDAGPRRIRRRLLSATGSSGRSTAAPRRAPRRG